MGLRRVPPVRHRGGERLRALPPRPGPGARPRLPGRDGRVHAGPRQVAGAARRSRPRRLRAAGGRGAHAVPRHRPLARAAHPDLHGRGDRRRGLGHLAVQILRAITESTVIAVDLDQEKLTAARGHGADHAVLSGPEAVPEILELTHGRGADVVLDFVGVTPTLSVGAGVVSSYGHLTVLGLGGGSVDFSASGPPQGLPWGATVSRPYGGTRRDLHEVLSLAQRGLIKVQVERHPLAAADDVLARLERGEVRGRAVLVP
ncbi:zinc-binding dehydrogenase [Nonomuraea recticatena]|uniref:zinc-binding dehydrogenase n=1 Tax=Nonomuraea recticatena TaxID=46178 RepID=UPI0036143920